MQIQMRVVSFTLAQSPDTAAWRVEYGKRLALNGVFGTSSRTALAGIEGRARV